MKTNLATFTKAGLTGWWFMAMVCLWAAAVGGAEPTFTNVTATVAPGLPEVESSSVGWADFDRDGRLDFLITGYSHNATNRNIAQLWRNTGSGFTDVTATVAPGLTAGYAAWADYDNDGWPDFLISTQLWRNTGTGFVNVTASVMPGLTGGPFAWGDYDGDGRPDLFLVKLTGCQIWRNTSSGFLNVTAAVAPTLPGLTEAAVAWGDYDNDGRLDFLLTGADGLSCEECDIPNGFSQLWHNTGNGFVNVTASVAPGLPNVYSSAVAWADFDNDGRLDFFIAGWGNGAVSQFWRNTGSGFVNVTANVAPGLGGIALASVAWGDYDSDGRLDLLISGHRHVSLASELWRNTPNGFSNVTASLIPGLPRVGYSSQAWGDYDNDGRLDFLLTGSLYRHCDGCDRFGAVSQLWRNETVQATPPPAILTGLPSDPSPVSVTLNARINPRGQTAQAWFIWGDSTNYGQATAPQPMGNGHSFSNFSEIITGLSTGATYYYRAVGSNDQGQVLFGSVQQFRLAAPDVWISPASSVSSNSATLDGGVDPHNLPAYGWFEWGLTPDLGQVTPVQFLGSGFNVHFGEILSGLESGANCYFRAVASNSLGVTRSWVDSLITPGPNVCPGYLSPSSRTHGYAATANSFQVSLNCNWTAINTNSWITFSSPTNGTGSAPLYYTVAENRDLRPRSGIIVIGGHHFWMTQMGQDPVFDTQPTNQIVFAGGTARFHVRVRGTPPITYQWRSDSVRAHHVPLVDGDGVSGATTPDLVLSNVRPSQALTYLVWVTTGVGGNDSVKVNLSVSCGFNLSASSASFNSLGATGSVALNTVSTNCAWNVANTNPWVTILSNSITNFGNGTVVYALTPNTTGLVRSGNIAIADQTFTITQAGGAATNADLALVEALDTEGTLSWDTVGTPAWFGQGLVAHDGVDAAQSGPISHDAAVTAWSTVTGPGTLGFWWKVSSETNKDFLKFFVNGVQQTRISGETDWQLLSYTFPSGTWTTKWTYSKNHQTTVGNDRGWLDQVRFVAGSGCVGTLSHSNATHSSAAETGQVNTTVPDGCTLNVITLSPWITNIVEPGSGFVRYILATNSLPFSRTGTNIIAGRRFTIVQEGAPLSCAYSISPTLRVHSHASATGTITVTAHEGCEWGVLNTNEWVTILSGTNGFGCGQLTYSIPANPMTCDRSGYIRIDAQVFFICQYGKPPCTYSINPVGATRSSGSASGVINVTTPEGSAWSASTSNAWITIVSGTNGSGDGEVAWSIAVNTTPNQRTGKIQIADQFFTIVQSGSTPITLAEALDTIGIPLIWTTSGNAPWFGQVNVTHDGMDAAQSGAIPDSASSTLQLTTNGPGTLSFWWKVSSEANNDTLRFNLNGSELARISGEVDWQQRTITLPSGSQTLQWTYSKNVALAAGQDRGWVDQVTHSGTNPPPDCTYSILPSSRTHGYGGVSNMVLVTTQNGCPWTVVNANPWVIIRSSLNNVGNGTVAYSLAPNMNAEPRSGNVAIGGQLFRLTQTGNPQRLEITSLSATGATLSVQGEAGRLYVVQCSEDLIHWIPISTNFASSTVIDTAVGNARQRFYRGVEMP